MYTVSIVLSFNSCLHKMNHCTVLESLQNFTNVCSYDDCEASSLLKYLWVKPRTFLSILIASALLSQHLSTATSNGVPTK